MGLSIDREKVIRGLEKCKHHECDDCTEKGASKAPWDCPAYDNFVDNALVLLKEQEPKQIVRKQVIRENPDGSTDYYTEWSCPHCGKILDRGFGAPWIDFCYKCGKAVKWE